MDIFILGGRRLEGCPPGSSNRLYHNNRDGTFTDVTEKAGLLDCGWACGVCVGDYNNDGFEDLFLTYYGQNRLYRNNGDGTFTDVTQKAGLLYPTTRFGSGAHFLTTTVTDCWICLSPITWKSIWQPRPNLLWMCPIATTKALLPTAARRPSAPQHFLYRNNGDGTFTDVSKESGIAAIRVPTDSQRSLLMRTKTAGRTFSSLAIPRRAMLLHEQP